ncbi:MAG TPA: amino acid ABC transporter substrate-binding protein [Geminicoccaceae bacterium]|nr:amino acid ABC transporter substrate-binding protein [Geminicoccus sp.]HMU51619.1 amino acid ABC transporter substrate-binding protein [Geminicoccaceae bacterium]
MRILFAAALAAATLATTADAGVLDRVKASGTLKLGVREDAEPFSYRGPKGEATGYSVELCRVVADEVARTAGLDRIRLDFVPVQPETRYDDVRSGKVDLLCGADTVTLARREIVDFSLLTFATGSTLLYRVGGPNGFDQLAGKKIGAVGGTTTEANLERALASGRLQGEMVKVAGYAEGVRDLADGRIAAFFGDGAILLYHWLQSPARDALKLSDRTLSDEPYALVMARGDDDFRLAVDRALARLYRSDRIEEIFADSFSTSAKPSDLVRALYLLNGLPE